MTTLNKTIDFITALDSENQTLRVANEELRGRIAILESQLAEAKSAPSAIDKVQAILNEFYGDAPPPSEPVEEEAIEPTVDEMIEESIEEDEEATPFKEDEEIKELVPSVHTIDDVKVETETETVEEPTTPATDGDGAPGFDEFDEYDEILSFAPSKGKGKDKVEEEVTREIDPGYALAPKGSYWYHNFSHMIYRIGAVLDEEFILVDNVGHEYTSKFVDNKKGLLPEKEWKRSSKKAFEADKPTSESKKSEGTKESKESKADVKDPKSVTIWVQEGIKLDKGTQKANKKKLALAMREFTVISDKLKADYIIMGSGATTGKYINISNTSGRTKLHNILGGFGLK